MATKQNSLIWMCRLVPRLICAWATMPLASMTRQKDSGGLSLLDWSGVLPNSEADRQRIPAVDLEGTAQERSERSVCCLALPMAAVSTIGQGLPGCWWLLHEIVLLPTQNHRGSACSERQWSLVDTRHWLLDLLGTANLTVGGKDQCLVSVRRRHLRLAFVEHSAEIG